MVLPKAIRSLFMCSKRQSAKGSQQKAVSKSQLTAEDAHKSLASSECITMHRNQIVYQILLLGHYWPLNNRI